MLSLFLGYIYLIIFRIYFIIFSLLRVFNFKVFIVSIFKRIFSNCCYEYNVLLVLIYLFGELFLWMF